MSHVIVFHFFMSTSHLFFSSGLGLELEEKVELQGECGVRHDNLLAVFDAQFEERLCQVGARLLLEARGELHVQRLALAADGRLLELGLGAHGQGVEQVLQGGLGVDLEGAGLAAADGAVVLFLVLEGVGVDAVVARVHHVVCLEAQAGGRRGGDLEGLVAAGGSNDGICRGDGGDDVLDGALRQRVGHARDAKLLRPD